MNSWIKADHDFGIPWVRLVVSLRSPVVIELMRLLELHAESPEAMALYCRKAVEAVRPDLHDCQVWGINCGCQPVTLTIDVSHPSLPRVGRFEMPSEQWLEPCAVCKRPMDKQWARGEGDRFVMCCSQECCVKPFICDYCGNAMVRPAADPWHEGTICKVCANSLGADAKPLPKKQWKDRQPPAEVTSCDIPIECDSKSWQEGILKAVKLMDKTEAGRQAMGTFNATTLPKEDFIHQDMDKILNTKVARAMIDRGQAFRCCKCEKLWLMRELSSCLNYSATCKACGGD